MKQISILISTLILILISTSIPASADLPSLTLSPTTDPIVTNIGGSETWKVTSNQTVNISFLINGTQVYYSPYTPTATYTNWTAAQGYWNLTINVNSSGGLNSTHINWTVANPPGISTSIPSAGALTYTSNTANTFNISINQTTNISWQIDGVELQYNETVAYGHYVNYTNLSVKSGTYNVTAAVNNTNGTVLNTWTMTVHNTPNIIVSPATSPIVTVINGSQTWTLTSNQTVNFSILMNGSQVQYNASTTSATYTNLSGKQGYWNITINVNSTGGANSTRINWTVANPPGIPTATTTGQVGAVDIVNSSRNFNISINQTSNISWQVNGVEVQYNTSIGYGKYVNYTNVSGRAGTWNITVAVNNSNGTVLNTWVWTVSESVISGTGVSTNLSNSSSRVKMGVNATLNFTLNDSAKIQDVNFTFPSGFYFSEVDTQDLNISDSLGVVTVTKSGSQVRLHNTTGQGTNHTALYVNFTLNLTMPATAGDYNVTITTDTNTTGTNVTVHVRDPTRPYFLQANNSNFTVVSETIIANRTTLKLSGSGNTNLTFYAVNITGQTNITVGYGATNATKVRTRYDATKGIVVIYVETNPAVTNPEIIVANAAELTSSNLPAAIITGGAIGGAIIFYIFRRRRH